LKNAEKKRIVLRPFWNSICILPLSTPILPLLKQETRYLKQIAITIKTKEIKDSFYAKTLSKMR
jgi:hypothetical protein